MKIRLVGTVKFNGVEYNTGKELDCSPDVATSLLESRVAVKVSAMSPSLQSVGVESVRETLTPPIPKVSKSRTKSKTRK